MQLGRAASDILFSWRRVRTLASPKGNYLGELMMKSWGVMTKWRLRCRQPWALEGSFSLYFPAFDEMLLMSHCLWQTSRSHVCSHTHSLVMALSSDAHQSLICTCSRWERRAWPTVLPAIHPRCKDRTYKSAVKCHERITLDLWRKLQERRWRFYKSNGLEIVQESEEANNMEVIFVLLSLNFP